MHASRTLALALATTAVFVVAGGGCPSRTACENSAQCAEGFACVPDGDEGISVCASSCAADLGCPAGQACVPRDDGSFEGACLDITGDLVAGDSCTEDRQCQTGACEGGDTAVCVEECTGDLSCTDAANRCILDDVRRVCVPPLDDRAAGEGCADPRECASGTCVDPPDVAGEDPAPPVCADNCTEASDCPDPGDACVRLVGGARACLEPLEDGLPCQSAEACEGGFCIQDVDGAFKCARACEDDTCDDGFACVDDTDGNRVCMPQLDERAAGEPCTTARQCASGHCAHFATETEELGTLCADPCGAGGACEAGLVCWPDPEATDVCGPTPSP